LPTALVALPTSREGPALPLLLQLEVPSAFTVGSAIG
jgi:hypothetical protein